MVSSYYCNQPLCPNSNSSYRAASLGSTPLLPAFPFSKPVKLKTTLYTNLKVKPVQRVSIFAYFQDFTTKKQTIFIYLFTFPKIMPFTTRHQTMFTLNIYCSSLCLFQKYNIHMQVRLCIRLPLQLGSQNKILKVESGTWPCKSMKLKGMKSKTWIVRHKCLKYNSWKHMLSLVKIIIIKFLQTYSFPAI